MIATWKIYSAPDSPEAKCSLQKHYFIKHY